MLLTMLHERGDRSRSHGLPVSVLKAQASALGVPLMVRPATWDDYEAVFIDALRELGRAGISVGVFGDIDLEEHREWVMKVCDATAVKPHLPLWGQPRKVSLAELIRNGFEATIVSVKKEVLDRRFLGRRIDQETVDDLEAAGVDASGEAGEYHTVVTNGPLFARPVEIRKGSVHERDGYLFLDVGFSGASICLDSADVRSG